MRYYLLIKILLVTMLLDTTSTYAANAKNNRRTIKINNQPSFGFKLGTTFNRVKVIDGNFEKISTYERTSMSSGNLVWIMAGLTSEYAISSQFVTAAEILYERQGFYSTSDFPGRIKLKQESVVLPISFKYYPVAIRAGISLQLGLQCSFIFYKKYYELAGEQTDTLKEKEVQEEDLQNPGNILHKSFDLAIISGIEYTFANGIKLGANISMGIVDRRKNKEEDPKTSIRSAGNQFYVGYNFLKLGSS